MIQLKTLDQIKLIKESGDILYATMQKVGSIISEGMTTLELDKIVYTEITKNKATPAFLNYGGFPGSACISINDEVIHGIPSKRKIASGDLVSVDIGVNYKGYISDSAYTFTIGSITNEEEELIKATQISLMAGIQASCVNNRVKDISKAIYSNIKQYGVVADYCGHGVGLSVHEDPQIPNVLSPFGLNPRLKAGMVIAIEPMVNLGTHQVELLEDDWTVRTLDRKKSVHFEHTVAITEKGPIILTDGKSINL